MDRVAVTNFVYGDGEYKIITLPPRRTWERIDAKEARARGADRIAPPDFEERIQRFLNGESINLAGGGRLRVGCAMGLLIDGQLVFGSFDMGHPSRPGYLTPAAGIFECYCSPLQKALDELSEEFIVTRRDTVGYWKINGYSTNTTHAKAWANAHGKRFDPDFKVGVELLYIFPHSTEVDFEDFTNVCLVEFEPDSSSIELIFVGKACLPDGVEIVDGERLPNGDWRGTPVIRWTPACTAPLTSKAEILVKTFGPKS